MSRPKAHWNEASSGPEWIAVEGCPCWFCVLPDHGETEQHFEHLPCECSQCAPFNGPVEERHEFHLLDRRTAYCVCGWAAEIPITTTLRRADEEPYDTVIELIDSWRAHIDDPQPLGPDPGELVPGIQ